jgi:glutamine synthetase
VVPLGIMGVMTAPSLAAASIAQLEAAGVDTLIGTVVNPAGLTHAKTVPVRRTDTFADPGLGASPVWHGFAIDQVGVVFSPGITVVGDRRIRIDLSALRPLGDGLAWAPGAFFDQEGIPDPACSRGTLSRVEARLAEAGLSALVGHELEFVLVGPDGSRLPSALWAQYGMTGVLEYEAFVRDVTRSCTAAGVAIEQFHPEYSLNQFEISFRPQTPTVAADHLVLARIIVGRIARRHGFRVSLSPVPFVGGVGSGAHQHFSLWSGNDTASLTPLFSGGVGARGMTREGEMAVAGLLDGLLEAQGMLCGSILSGLRIQPGHWAGAYVCWGAENREAAVRFLLGGPNNPHSANVEVKIVDPSANPYFASATVLGLALEGIEQRAVLPPETTVDPALLSDIERQGNGIVLLPSNQADSIIALDKSARMRRILGDAVVDVTVAVRDHEQSQYSSLGPEALAEKFRMAWSL